jgi:hypothetical protein
MNALLRILLLLVLLLSPAWPRGTYRSARCTRPAARRIHRSRAARDAFERSHPCPATGGWLPGEIVGNEWRYSPAGGASLFSVHTPCGFSGVSWL